MNPMNQNYCELLVVLLNLEWRLLLFVYYSFIERSRYKV